MRSHPARILLFAISTLLAAPALAADLDTDQKRYSYILGFQVGTQSQSSAVQVDEAAFLAGMRDGRSGADPKLTREDVQATMARIQQQQRDDAKRQVERNQAEGEAFLAANKAKAGVKVMPSGLQYRVIRAGSGASPKATDTVEVHYRGTLVDGTEFDSSYSRGQPATFPVNRVIPGWTEALQAMQEGAKWQIYVPAQLAYGARGAGPKIGPNATLIFDVELLKVK